MARKTPKTAPKTDPKPKFALPDDVTLADCKYPDWGESLPYEDQKALGLTYESGWSGSLTFYYTEKLGWVLCTLHISNASRSQKARGVVTDRSYGIGIKDEKVYTVGRGPHVLSEIQVYLRKDAMDRLEKYVKLWLKGMADAGNIRDRISSRRAQGQAYRAEGRSFWTW